MNKEIATIRAELWKDVAVGVATSSNSTRPETCINWADRIVEAFDKRFDATKE